MIALTVETAEGKRLVRAPKGSALSSCLYRERLFLPQPCGGKGTCGKCRVRFLSGAPQANEYDCRFLSEKQLKQGYRISCKCVLTEDCHVLLPEGGDDIWPPFMGKNGKDCGKIERLSKQSTKLSTNPQGIAIDIGTTTLAFACYDLESSECLGTYAMANHQASYGADVLSRIRGANEGKGEALQDTIRRDLEEGLCRLLEEDPSCSSSAAGGKPPVPASARASYLLRERGIERIVIAANTTMCHLLLGYSCEGLGQAPFTPESVSMVKREVNGVEVTILPGISAFVGGDIVAGLSWLKGDSYLLLDLGTNGEMVLHHNNTYYCASAAAGPALEGGEISCGVPGIPGAVSHVKIDRGMCRVETIAGKPPVGICGSGIIDAVAQLRSAGILDAQGMLGERFRDDGYPVFVRSQFSQIRLTQEDIQKVLTAKSAIAAGVEILCREAGVAMGDIGQIYLAGGFGVSLDIKSALGIGLLPGGIAECAAEGCDAAEIADRVRAVGNTSLAGAAAYLLDADEKKLREITARARVISLAGHPDFEKLFLEGLGF